jgi:hypothetical protein
MGRYFFMKVKLAHGWIFATGRRLAREGKIRLAFIAAVG